jgi:hypothetical protein
MLADASRKHQSVESAERGSKRSNLALNAVDEHIDRLARSWVRAGQQRTHIARDVRQTEQARSLVQETLQIARAQAMPVDQV